MEYEEDMERKETEEEEEGISEEPVEPKAVKMPRRRTIINLPNMK